MLTYYVFAHATHFKGDFPNVELYRKILRETKDISAFKKLDKNLVYEMDKVLTGTFIFDH